MEKTGDVETRRVPIVVLLIGLAVLADRLLPQTNRLPMQWDAAGRSTWSAPRPLALGFLPASATITLAVVAVSHARAGLVAGGAFLFGGVLSFALPARRMR